jgi:hypothetical protein
MAARGFGVGAVWGVLAAFIVVLLPLIQGGGLTAGLQESPSASNVTASVPGGMATNSTGIFASTVSQVNASIQGTISSVPHQGGLLVVITLLPVFLGGLAGVLVYLSFRGSLPWRIGEKKQASADSLT